MSRPPGKRFGLRGGTNLLYIGGNMLSRIGVLVSLPLLLRLLTKQEYGLIVLAEVVGTILGGLGGAQLDQALTRLYHEWSDDEKGPMTRALFNRHALLAHAVLGGGLVCIGLYGWFVAPAGSSALALGVALTGYYLTFVSPLALFAWLRISEDLTRFFAFNLVRFLGIQGGGVLVACLSPNPFWGYLIGTLGLAAAYNVGTWFYIWRVLPRARVAQGRMKEAMAYAVPLMSSNFLQVLQSVADRILVQLLLGLEALSIYAVAARLVSLLANVHEAIKLNYVPRLFQYASSRDSAQLERVVREAGAGLEVLFWVGFLLMAFNEPLIWLLGGTAYAQAGLYAPGLIWAGYAGSVTLYVAPGIVVEKRTQWAVVPSGLQIAGSVVCAILLVQHLGLLALSMGKIVASVLFIGAHVYLTRRLSPSFMSNLPSCLPYLTLLGISAAASSILPALPRAAFPHAALYVYGVIGLIAMVAVRRSLQFRRGGATG